MDPSLLKKLERLGVVKGERFQRKELRDLRSVIDGELIMLPEGELFLKRKVVPLNRIYGGFRFEQLHELSGDVLSLLANDAELSDARGDKLLFLDTETTGLSGGSGTYAFMIGIGFIRDNAFVVEQLFLRAYTEELAMLAYLKKHLQKDKILITFNGKAFDVPLLTTRFIMYRQPPVIEYLSHLDLMHPARRFWRGRSTDCSLTTLEQDVFGIRRVNDIPGHLVPIRYFQYQRTGDPEPLKEVFEHNYYDVLSMVTLTLRMKDLLRDFETDGWDKLTAGRLLTSRGEIQEGITRLEQSLQHQLPLHQRYKALKELAQYYKNTNQWEKALECWKEMTLSEYPFASYPWIELAKYYEHIGRDYQEALRWTEELLSFKESYDEKCRNELQHRRSRLLERIKGLS